MLVSIGFLLFVIFSPLHRTKGVLAYSTNVNPAGLLEATNEKREQAGKTDLRSSDLLNQAAQSKAQDMATRNYWSHQTPEGNDPWVFINTAHYAYQKAGENLAYGFADNAEVVEGWMTSQTHRENMLDKAFQEVGFGIATNPNYRGNGPATIVVAMYAVPSSSPVGAGLATHVLGAEHSVAAAQLMTGVTWIVYFILGFIVMAGIYLLITHSNAFRRAFKKGETYVVKRPMIDSVLIIVIAIGIMMLRLSGSIL